MNINKNSIRDQVYKMLKEKILKQELKVGEKISSRKIARDNGISVMPVRDGLLKLTNDGLVVNKPRVGFYVRNFTKNEVNNIMEVREMYEVYCLKNHFANIDRDEIKKLQNEMEAVEDDLQRIVFDKIDISLHYTFIQASENNFLIAKYEQIKDLVILFQHLHLARMEKSHQEHEMIAENILAGNKEKVVELVISHLRDVNEGIKRSLGQK